MSNVNNNDTASVSTTEYNVMGYIPVKSVFRIPVDEMKAAVLHVAKAHLSDVQTVTFAHNRSGEVTTFVWLPKNSGHLRDNSITQGNSLIANPVSRFTPELLEFMKRFCDKDKKRVFRDNMNAQPLKAMVVRLDVFLKIIFDSDGSEYATVYKQNRPRLNLNAAWHFRRNSGNEFGSLEYLEVVKSIRTEMGGEPVPVDAARV